MKTQHRLRPLLIVSSLMLLALSTSASAASDIAVQPPHEITGLGEPMVLSMAVAAGSSGGVVTVNPPAAAAAKKCFVDDTYDPPKRICTAIRSKRYAVTPNPTVIEFQEQHAQIWLTGAYTMSVVHGSVTEKTNEFQVTVVDRSPNQAVDRATGGKVTFTARCWNPPRYPRAIEWYYNDAPLADGVVPRLGTVSGSGTSALTISNLSVGNPRFYAKVHGYGSETLNTGYYQVNVTPVAPVIPKSALGSYVGIIDPGNLNGGAGGRVDLTISSTGTSANVRLAGAALVKFSGLPVSVNGNILTGYMTKASIAPVFALAFQIDTTTNRFVTGACTVSRDSNVREFAGWKQTPAPLNLQGRYNFALATGNPSLSVPQGRSFGSFTVAANGAYTVTGRTACNEVMTCTAFVGPDANSENFALFSIQPSRSTFSGMAVIDANSGLPNYLNSSGFIWRRPANISTTVYPAGFLEVAGIDGGRFNASSTLLTSWIAANGGSTSLTFGGAGLPASLDPNRFIIASDVTTSGSVQNAVGKATYGSTLTAMKLATNTGLLDAAGSQFDLLDYSAVDYGNIARHVNYYGIVFPTPNTPTGLAMDGYFMLQQMPTTFGVTPPTYSGAVFLR